MNRLIRSVMEPLARISRRFFDPRFQQLEERMIARFDEIHAATDELAKQVQEMSSNMIEVLSFVGRRLDRVNDVAAALTKELDELKGNLLIEPKRTRPSGTQEHGDG